MLIHLESLVGLNIVLAKVLNPTFSIAVNNEPNCFIIVLSDNDNFAVATCPIILSNIVSPPKYCFWLMSFETIDCNCSLVFGIYSETIDFRLLPSLPLSWNNLFKVCDGMPIWLVIVILSIYFLNTFCGSKLISIVVFRLLNAFKLLLFIALRLNLKLLPLVKSTFLVMSEETIG